MHDRDLADILAIERWLVSYARAVDTKDWELYRSLFTADAHIDGLVGDRNKIAERLAESLAPVSMMMHYISNVEIDIDGDSARVRTMFYNPLQVPGFDQPSYCGGYYHHTMVRTPLGWRSQRLREESLWFVNSPT